MPMELNEAGPPGGSQGPGAGAAPESLQALLRANPDWLRRDPDLLASLGLRLDAANIVDFGPVALSRASAARQRALSERLRMEAMAQANFAAQSRTHAAVIDLLGAGGLTDLALRIDEAARLRFGLDVGVLALEGAAAPGGWARLMEGQADMILAGAGPARLGPAATARGLFGTLGPAIESAAIVRFSPWTPARPGLMALGARDPQAFTPDMGADLVIFLAQVVQRIARRWPSP